MKLIWSNRAITDLKEITDFISLDNPAKAVEHSAKLVKRMRQAKRFPHSGRMVPEMRRADIRELVEGSYRLVYKLEERLIVVLRVLESHRLFRIN